MRCTPYLFYNAKISSLGLRDRRERKTSCSKSYSRSPKFYCFLEFLYLGARLTTRINTGLFSNSTAFASGHDAYKWLKYVWIITFAFQKGSKYLSYKSR